MRNRSENGRGARVALCAHPTHIPYVLSPNKIWWRVQIMKLLIMKFSSASFYFSFTSKHSVQLNICKRNLCSSLKVNDYNSQPHKKNKLIWCFRYTAASMKVASFRDTAPRSLVKVDRRAFIILIKSVHISETSVYSTRQGAISHKAIIFKWNYSLATSSFF
jgi:hypothetical protein